MTDRDKLIEAMARSMALAAGAYEGPELHWLGYEDDAQAALAAIEANGLVVVPREPTEAMLKAAAAAMSPGKRPTNRFVSNSEKHRIRYTAMIGAAPLHAAPNEGEG